MADKYLSLDNTGRKILVESLVTSLGESSSGEIVALNSSGKINFSCLSSEVEKTTSISLKEYFLSGW